MQNLINYYFKQLCDDKFFENNEEVIIGKAKDVIKISVNPMVGFYELVDAELLLEEIKIYYEELGD